MAERGHHPQSTSEEILEAGIEGLEEPVFRRSMVWIGGAVGLLVVIGAVVLAANLRGGLSSPAPAVREAPTVDLTDPRGEVEGPPAAFRWRGRQQAATYVVTVRRAAGEVVLLQTSTQPWLVPAVADRALMNPGVYTWSVEARQRDGTAVGHGEASFEIGRPQARLD